jgi:peptidoglycan-associated lipoprotein
VFIKRIFVIFCLFFVSGCTMFNQKEPDVIVTTEPMLTKTDEGETDTVTAAESINLNAVEGKGFTLGNNTIYFDYDQYSVDKEEDKNIIKLYSNYMIKNKKAIIRIEGHADERGSRAYNLALGEKRAETIKEIMLINGVSKNSIEVVSYGEENPAVIGKSEETYSLNRRVEIIFINSGK